MSTALRRKFPGDAGPASTVTNTCQYMENHRPVMALGPQSALGTATTADGHPVVFAFDSSGTFHVSVSADGSSAPWSNYPIAGQVMDSYAASAAPKPKLFAVSQQVDGGPITVALVVTTQVAGGGVADDLWLLPAVDSAADAAWLKNGPTTWVKLPFNLNVGGVVADQLSVDSLRALPATAAGSSPISIVFLRDTNLALLPFAVDLSGATAAAWTQLLPGDSYSTVAAVAAGQIYTGFYPGLYTAYTGAGGTNELIWTSSGDPVTEYKVTAPSAIAVLPVSGNDGSVYTDLFVSDGDQLLYFPYDAQPDGTGKVPPTVLVSGKAVTGCTELQVASDGQMVSLWGLNADGYLFHIQAPAASYGDPSAWSTPVPMITAVTALAMHISATRGLTSLFAVQNQGSTPQLFEMHKDHLQVTGGHWRKRPVHLATEDKYETLQTYSHRLQFLDDDAMPVGGRAVTVTTTTSIVLEVNGVTVSVPSKPAQPVTVTTTAAGVLDIVQIADTPAAPILTFTLDTASATVDPTAPVRQAITDNLTKTPSPNPPPASWQPRQKIDPDQAGQAVTAINDNGPSSVDHELGSIFGTFLGDICMAVAEAFEDLVKIAVEAGKFVVTFAEYTFSAIVHTFEDIAAAFTSLLQAIGAALEDVFKWLAFLFDWDNIKAIQQNLVAFHNDLLTGLGSAFGGILTNIAEWIEYYGDQIAKGADLSASLPGNSVQNSSKQSNATAGQNTPSGSPGSTDPRLSWGQNQTPPVTAGAQAGHGASKSVGDDPFATAMAQFGTDVASFLLVAGEQLGDLLDGSDNLQQAGEALQGKIGTLVGDVGKIVAACGTDISDELATIDKLINKSIDIPLFSALFDDIFKEDLTVLNLVTLLEAVPATYLYGLATDGNGQASAFLNPDDLASLQKTLAHIGKHLPKPPKSAAAAEAPSPRPLGEGDTLTGSLQVALGLLHAARCITTMGVGAAETAQTVAPTDLTVAGLYAAIRWDAGVWVLEAATSLMISVSETGKPEFTDIFNMAFSASVLKAILTVSPTNEEQVEAVAKFMGCLSVIVGAMEAVAGGIEIADGDDAVEKLLGCGELLYGLNEIVEIGQLIKPASAESISGARAGLALFAGVAMLVGGLVTIKEGDGAASEALPAAT